MEKLVRFSRFYEGCRLGNQLYFPLATYSRNRLLGTNYHMCAEESICSLFRRLGITEKYCHSMTDDELLHVSNGYAVIGGTAFLQTFGTDYTEETLNGFISETILKSDAFAESDGRYDYDDNTVAISIRNGNYLTIDGYAFDFDRFLDEGFSMVDGRKAVVFSDDIPYTEQVYGERLIKRFIGVRYHENISPVDDLVTLSRFKKKIIWNSTFSYWAAYIGDVLYGDAHETIVPLMHKKNLNGDIAWQLNRRKWKTIRC